MRRTLILGLGNPVLSDDGVGLRVVERLLEEGLPPGVDAEVAGTAGLGILDLVAEHERLIIVDAIDAGLEPGAVELFDLHRLAAMTPLHTASSHDTDLLTVLEVGARLGRVMPASVQVVAVQVNDVTTFAEHCTPAVEAAVAEACRSCRRLLERA